MRTRDHDTVSHRRAASPPWRLSNSEVKIRRISTPIEMSRRRPRAVAVPVPATFPRPGLRGDAIQRSMCGVFLNDTCRNSDIKERYGFKEDAVTKKEKLCLGDLMI
ncbi:hypothetical protein EVAR_66838_1 [Eumeta japonica]|uniref:Uncharacterized protein n=1 Tax=Eumeta variegata TaxID=151549 RepID=A0A4C1ZA02_EUMVA|nr:hypothetical protein EVAR_66838_1 [Eumeta japonica]